MSKRATISAVCVSEHKGTSKRPVEAARLVEEYGIEGDAHAGTPKRQVSLLCVASIDKMRAKGADLAPGDFAENLTLDGCTVADFPIGARVSLPSGALLEVTQLGKKCHTGCAIKELVGDCVMPREGIFARVVRGGRVAQGDCLEVSADES